MDEILEYADGDEAFAYWLRELDEHLFGEYDTSVLDLPDDDYRTFFEEGIPSRDAAMIVMSEL